MNLTPDQKSLIDYLKSGSEYENYIFKNLNDPSYFHPFLEAGLFDASHNPVPKESERDKNLFYIPQWPALRYLEAISSKLPDNSDIARDIMVIFRNVTRPNGDRNKRADNYRTGASFVRIIANLPSGLVSVEDIGLISDWLKSNFDTSLVGAEIAETLLPKLLSGDQRSEYEKAIKLLDIVTSIEWVDERNSGDQDSRKPNTKIGTYWLEMLFRKNSGLLSEKCGDAAINILSVRLVEIISKYPERAKSYYHYRPAIENSNQNLSREDTENILVDALRDILIIYSGNKDATVQIREFLKCKHLILKRIALHTVNQYYDKYSSLFWEFMEYEGSSVFLDNNLRHEVYMLLKTRFKEFSSKQADILRIISTLSQEWKLDKDKVRYNAMLRFDWLSAIYNQGNNEADDLYKQYKKDLGYDPDHPEFSSYITSGSMEHKLPITSADLLSKGSTKSIVDFLNAYEGKNDWGESNDGNLAGVLKSAVKSNPVLFEKNISDFLLCKQVYQVDLLSGFKELWEEKRPINWSSILDFSLKIIELDKFWKRDHLDRYGISESDRVVTEISDLIQAGVKDDKHAFDPEYFPLTGKILTILLLRQVSRTRGDESDPLTTTINVSKGRVLLAFMNFVLRVHRHFKDSEHNRNIFWKSIEPVFEAELEKGKRNNYEFFAVMGEYLPQMFSINQSWVESNMNKLFPKEPEFEPQWRFAIDGYHYVGVVYDVVYKALKANGDFDRVLTTPSVNERIRERFIDNIAIAYLRGLESMNDTKSMFYKLLDAWSERDISDVIHLFWMHRDAELDKKHIERILDFWGYCYQKVQGSEKINLRILSDLNLLTTFISDLTPNLYKCVLQSAPYVDFAYHSTFFLEYLDRLVNQYPREIGDIFLKMLEKTIPTFREESIVSIVEKLYINGNKIVADAVCDKYRRAGHEFLVEIYEKHNPPH